MFRNLFASLRYSMHSNSASALTVRTHRAVTERLREHNHNLALSLSVSCRNGQQPFKVELKRQEQAATN